MYGCTRATRRGTTKMNGRLAGRVKPALLGAVEGGGTRFVCAVGTSPSDILDSTDIRTTDPASTMAECIAFFRLAQAAHGPLAALGVGCFGPLGLRPGTPDHGHVLATPKRGWSGAAIVDTFANGLGVPVAVDTDVGAAALGEWRLGAGRGMGSLAYVTVGTGIGGAAVPVGPVFVRLMHAEMGHLPVRRDPRDQHIAGYLGQLAASIALMMSVQRIVLGGGVMTHAAMLPLLRTATHACLQGYL